MNIAIEKQPKCIAVLSVEVPADDVATKRESITSNYVKQARISGFRPGKAPKHVIQKRFGKEITGELQQALFSAACDKALDDEKLKVIDFGFLDNLNERPDGSMSFDTKLILAPEFELPEYKGIEIKAPSTEITDKEIDGQLENLRERLADFKDISDRALENGDIAVVDFTTSVDGTPLLEAVGEKGEYLAKRENHWLPIKPSDMLPGYAEQLAGLKEGDKKDVTISLDDEFPLSELRGKNLTLHTVVTGIKEQTLPELDDAFAAKLLPDKTLEELKEMLRENMGQEKAKHINELKVNQLVEKLNSKISFELPDEIVQRETQSQVNALAAEGSQKGVSDEAMIDQQEDIIKAASARAENNLRTNFILQEIANKENLSVADTELLGRINEIAQQRKEQVKKTIKDLQKNGQIQSIRNSMLIGKAIDFILEQATVTEVSQEEFETEAKAETA